MRRHRSIFLFPLFALLSLAAVATGCGNKHEVETARHSLFNTDFAVVYSAALDATRELYPTADDLPGAGAIKTSWHQVQSANNGDDLANQRTMQNGQLTSAAAAGGMPSQGPAIKRFFIRFDVTVTGGRPWRVKVIGHASEWEPGAAMPNELHGIARPPWLEGRTDALTLAIFRRIKKFAVPMKEEVKADPDAEIAKTDATKFTRVPQGAAKRLAHLRDVIVHRDYAALRGELADDVVFSLGAEGNADVALALWQADPEGLEAMVRLITPLCVTENDKQVSCGVAKPGAYRLVIELRGTDWKLASFLKTE